PPGAGNFAPPPGFSPSGQAAATDAKPDAYDIFDNRRLQFRSDIGDGVGYAKGYQTFGAFQPIILQPDELLLLVNPREIVTYLGNSAANVGSGGRMYDPESDRILGVSRWYDHDNTGQNKFD